MPICDVIVGIKNENGRQYADAYVLLHDRLPMYYQKVVLFNPPIALYSENMFLIYSA